MTGHFQREFFGHTFHRNQLSGRRLATKLLFGRDRLGQQGILSAAA